MDLVSSRRPARTVESSTGGARVRPPAGARSVVAAVEKKDDCATHRCDAPERSATNLDRRPSVIQIAARPASQRASNIPLWVAQQFGTSAVAYRRADALTAHRWREGGRRPDEGGGGASPPLHPSRVRRHSTVGSAGLFPRALQASIPSRPSAPLPLCVR